MPKRQSRAKAFGIFSQGNYAGVDQGVDFSGSGPIPALGDGVVTDVGRSSIIEGGNYWYVVYKMTKGPYQGAYVYVAENFKPTVRTGQRVKRGQSVGEAIGHYPYIEVGFNRTGKGWSPTAPLNPNPHGAKAAGTEMWNLIRQEIGLGGNVTIGPQGYQSGSGFSPGRGGARRGSGQGSIPTVTEQDQAQQFSPQESVMGDVGTGYTSQPLGGVNDLTGLPISQTAAIWQELAQSQNASPETNMLADNSRQLTQTTPSFLM